jgi:hypothetical protein
MVNRRQVILGMGVLAATSALPLWWYARAGRPGRPVFFSAADNDQGEHTIAMLDAAGRTLQQARVPQRAHSVAVSPDGARVVYFARRPGREAWCLSTDSAHPPRQIHSQPGRHFFGHGCFSADGRRLFTAENDYDQARGVIVERDADTLEIRRELSSHGVGPHDVRLMPDGQTLVVANGGIETHPDVAREKLNLDTMQPALTYIDIATGKVVEQVKPPHHQLSIRHLWVAPDGQVGVAMQYQGPVLDRQPLVAFHRRGEPLRTALAPIAPQRGMRGYTASICIDPATRLAAVTCPRGNLVTFWHSETAKFAGRIEAADPGGANLDPSGQGFIVTTSTGQLLRTAGPDSQSILAALPAHHWDNHLVTAAG